ncbi:unnamed protein product [Mortierella alpina]
MPHLCLFCNLRPQGYRTVASLQSHILVVHDGGARVGVLTCDREGCGVFYYSRFRYNKHRRRCRAPIYTPRGTHYHWTHPYRNKLDIHSNEDLVPPFDHAPAKPPVDDESKDADACVEEQPEAHPDSDFDDVSQDADAFNEERSDAHSYIDLEDVSSCDTRSLDSDLRPEASHEVNESWDKPLRDHSVELLDEHSGEHSSEKSGREAESAVPEQSALEQTSGGLIEHGIELAVSEQSLHEHATGSGDIQETRSSSDLALPRAGLLNYTASTNDLLSLVNGLVKYVEQPSIGTGQAMLQTASSAKRRRDDVITLHRPNKKQNGQVPRSALQNLGDALSLHPFGKLLRIDQFEPMEPNLFLADVHSHGEDIAKTLAGSLLQSGSTVILIIRVEVYGRCRERDVHGFKSVKPTWDLKEIKFVYHNNRRKLLIGTSCWNAIVTASINLASGDITVGIDNPSMPFLGQTKLWARRDCALNPLLKRPSDNSGQQEGGFSQQAAMFYLFLDQTRLPLTSCRGSNNGHKKRNSGAKDKTALSVCVAANGGNRQVEKIFVDGGFTTTKAFDDELVLESIRKTIDLLLHDRKGKARAYHS